MQRNDVLYLVAETITENEIGDFVETSTETMVFCERKSIRQSEFYQAAANGLKPEIAFSIYSFEYNDEKKIKYNDKLYNVIRTYQVNDDDLEIICEGGVDHGHA